jgi:hypothetical protein
LRDWTDEGCGSLIIIAADTIGDEVAMAKEGRVSAHVTLAMDSRYGADFGLSTATLERQASAQLRRPRPRSAMSGQRRLRSG